MTATTANTADSTATHSIAARSPATHPVLDANHERLSA
jgi:hypothetical protein